MFDIDSPGLPPAIATPFSLMEHAFGRLSRRVHDMAQAELEWAGPPGNINSTAMLVAHLARTDLEYLHCIMGTPVPPALEAAYGPERMPDDTLPAVTGRAGADLLQSYRAVLDLVRDYLMAQTDADALRPVEIPWWPEPATLRYVLWHMAGHSMFHQGQIVRLRAWYAQPGA